MPTRDSFSNSGTCEEAMAGYTAEQLRLVLEVFDRLHETSLRVTALLREGE